MKRLLLIAGAAALLALPAGAQANPRPAGTFDLSGQPKLLAQGPDGNIWVTLTGSSLNNTLARIKPNGAVKEYDPPAVVNPVGIVAGPDGNLWLTRNGGVIRVPPDDPDSAQDFDIAAITDPRSIVKGPNGKLWTASGDQLVSFRASNPTGFDTQTINGMGARDITVSNHKLWIADFGGQRIVSSTPDGNVHKYNVGGGPQGIASGPNKTIAYANPGTDPQTVGRITDGGHAKTTKDPNSDPFGMRFAPDHRWWIAEFAKSQLGILSPNGDLKQFKHLPNGSGPRQLTLGPHHTLWVGLETAEKVARIKGVGG
jgi:virginiamycin B lyase